MCLQETYQKHVGYHVKAIRELSASSAVEGTDGLLLVDVPPDGAGNEAPTLSLHAGQGVFKGT